MYKNKIKKKDCAVGEDKREFQTINNVNEQILIIKM